MTTAAAGSTAHLWKQGRAQGCSLREPGGKAEGWKCQGQAELREGGMNSRRIPVLDPSPREHLGSGVSMGERGKDSILSGNGETASNPAKI